MKGVKGGGGVEAKREGERGVEKSTENLAALVDGYAIRNEPRPETCSFGFLADGRLLANRRTGQDA